MGVGGKSVGVGDRGVAVLVGSGVADVVTVREGAGVGVGVSGAIVWHALKISHKPKKLMKTPRISAIIPLQTV